MHHGWMQMCKCAMDTVKNNGVLRARTSIGQHKHAGCFRDAAARQCVVVGSRAEAAHTTDGVREGQSGPRGILRWHKVPQTITLKLLFAKHPSEHIFPLPVAQGVAALRTVDKL
jgi:hypothetical protein